MSSEIKSITISNSVAKEAMGIPVKRRGRTKKNLHGGGDEISSGVPSQIIKIDTSIPAIPTPTVPTPTIPTPTIPTPTIPTKSSFEPPVSATQGGASSIKPIRVELKKRTATKKVQLQPKKVLEPTKSLKKGHETRKQRKVSLGISTMHRRLTRAKKMQSRVKGMPLDQLKAQLIEKKLIKSTSKAPEAVLRQIAEDAQLVASKTL